MTTVAELLTKAREMIQPPQAWCRGYGEAGKAVCAVHAIQLARGDDKDLCRRAVRVLGRAMGLREPTEVTVGCWNDEHNHSDVISAFDAAIEMEQQS